MNLKTLLAMAVAALIGLAQPASAGDPPARASGAPATVFNMFDASTWKDTGGEMKPGTVVAFNPVDPASWAMFFDRKTHNRLHMAFTNPAQYGQFMQPQFFIQFMSPATWMKMANPSAYAPFMDPANLAYWMQPGAYVHAMNPAGYMQGANPAAWAPYMNPQFYMTWANPSAYAAPAAAGADKAPAFNFFDPKAWMKAFQPQASANGEKNRG